jgi:endo-1,4-beta-xylanase
MWNGAGVVLPAWLNERGVAAFVLKYRLERTDGYNYTVAKEAFDDTRRAIRIVRARAAEWNVNPHRIGVHGISAGGAMAAYANIRFDRGDPNATDPVERQSCRPDFVALVVPGLRPIDSEVPKDAAPAFIACAGIDDKSHARDSVKFHTLLFEAGVSSEVHIYAHGGHNGGNNPLIPFGTWNHRYHDWLADLGMLKPAAAP